MIFAASPALAFNADSFSLNFGSAENEVMYYNHKIPGFEEIYPLGPAGFCVFDDNKIAVADTFNHALKIFDDSGKLLENIDILKIARGELKTNEVFLSAIAHTKNAKGENVFYVSDIVNGKVFEISAGKLGRAFGSAGDRQFEFAQPEMLAVSPGGNILAGDFAKNKIAVFSDAGIGLREMPWNLNGFAMDDKYYYSLENVRSGEIAVVRSDISGGAREVMANVFNPAWRLAKIIGVDGRGNIIAAFFDDSVQEKLAAENSDRSCNGFFTVAFISPAGQIRDRFDVPVTTPGGNQFFFDKKDNALYYQDYNADRAPAGKYKIARIAPALDWSAKSLKINPSEMMELKKNITDVEYGSGAAKIVGSLGSVTNCPPLLRADRFGYFYIIDRLGGKIIRIQQEFTSLKTIEITGQINGKTQDIADAYVVSSTEIYLLDSKNQCYYQITAGREKNAALEAKKVDFSRTIKGHIDRIFANSLGEVILYSTVSNESYYMIKDQLKNTVEVPSAYSFFVMPNSDILSLIPGASKGEINIDYSDFYRNRLKRFDNPPSEKLNCPASSAHVIGVDEYSNFFVTFFDGTDQKIAVHSMTGDKFCELKITIPQYYRYFETSACVGANGTLYLGLPAADKYYLVKVPYSSLIDYIRASYIKGKK